MYLTRMPRLFDWLFPELTWRMPAGTTPAVYLSFDDGPIPEVTPWVLEQLRLYDAKATFFCVGDNIRKHPDIFRQILAEGHSAGNHSHNHLNGWKTDTDIYLENVGRCQQQMAEAASHATALFRPPYGRLRKAQQRALQKQYNIVMWDVLSGDFDPDCPPERCLNNVIRHARPGSIIVFHDSLKAAPRLRYALPQTLKCFQEKGWKMLGINNT